MTLETKAYIDCSLLLLKYKIKSIGRDVSIPKDEHMEKEKGETFCFVTLRNKAGGKKQLFISKSGVEVIK